MVYNDCVSRGPTTSKNLVQDFARVVGPWCKHKHLHLLHLLIHALATVLSAKASEVCCLVAPHVTMFIISSSKCTNSGWSVQGCRENFKESKKIQSHLSVGVEIFCYKFLLSEALQGMHKGVQEVDRTPSGGY